MSKSAWSGYPPIEERDAEIKRLREELAAERSAWENVVADKYFENEQLNAELASWKESYKSLLDSKASLIDEIERLRGELRERLSQDILDDALEGWKKENERLRKELAEKDDYIRTVSRPIGAHNYE